MRDVTRITRASSLMSLLIVALAASLLAGAYDIMDEVQSGLDDVQCKHYNSDRSCLIDRLSSASTLTRLRHTNITDVKFTQLAIDYMEEAIASCTNVCVDHGRPLRLLVYEAVAGILGVMTSILEREYSTSTVLKVIKQQDLVQEIASSIKAGPAGVDMWLLPTHGMGDIVAAGDGYFGSEAQNEAFLSEGGRWMQVHPAAASLYKYNSSVIGIPIGYHLPYLYYRIDFFEANNLTVPSTWEEMAQLVELFNGTDFDGDGEADRSLCLNSAHHHFLLEHVLGTMTQTRGLASGHLIDPDTMKPLVNNPAMEKALKLVARLLPNAHGYGNVRLSKFNEGRCIMAIDAATVFKGWNSSTSPVKAEHYGIAMPPGSKEVLDRTNMQLVPCTKYLCSDYNGVQKVYYNRAPNHGMGGTSISTNPSLPAAYQDFLSSSINVGLTAVGGAIHKGSLTTPVQNALLDTSEEGMKPWLQQGYDPAMAMMFVSVSRQILDHPNLGMELRIPLRTSYEEVLREVVYAPGFASKSMESGISVNSRRLEQSSEYGGIMVHMENAFNKILHEDVVDFGMATLIYRTSIDWTSPFHATPGEGNSRNATITTAINGDSSDSSSTTLIVAIVVPAFSIVLILVGAVYIYKTRHKKNRKHDWMGAVMAPLPGPETTLMITDIESSTILWEQLPAEIMNSVVKMHHGVIRAQLVSCSGYESATEGDSFLIAFHSPADAVLFAIRSQDAMLSAPWPQDLLDLPQCAPRYMMEIPSVRYLLCDNPVTKPMSAPEVQQARNSTTTYSIALESDDHQIPTQQPSRSNRLPAGLDSAPSPRPSEQPSSASLASHTAIDFAVNQVSRLFDRFEDFDIRNSFDSHFQPTKYEVGQENLALGSQDNLKSQKSLTLHDYLKRNVSTNPTVHTTDPVDLQSPQSVLIWRGLRVRMGIHSGMSESDDAGLNKVSGRIEYGGSLLELAHAVEGAAAGGAILLSEQAFKLLGSVQEAVVAHAGLCSLKGASGPLTVNVMQVLNQVLLYRCATFTPLSPSLRIEPGFLQTPFGQGTICFMTTADDRLKCLDKEARGKVIEMWHSIAKEELLQHEGYILEASKSLVLASFLRPSDAIKWALTTNSALQSINIEEVSGLPVQGADEGLLLKSGLDHGPHRSFLNPVSGRIEHRGKVMNRSARICSFSKSGEVCCSQATWLLARREMGYMLKGTSMVGPSRLQARSLLEGSASCTNFTSKTAPSTPRRNIPCSSHSVDGGSVAAPMVAMQLASRDEHVQSWNKEVATSSSFIPRHIQLEEAMPFQMESSTSSKLEDCLNTSSSAAALVHKRKHSVQFIINDNVDMGCESANGMDNALPDELSDRSLPVLPPDQPLQPTQALHEIVATNLGSKRLKGIQEEVIIVKLHFKQ